MRNATINVNILGFLPKLKRCMLGDYDVIEFENLWGEMVAEFGLENKIGSKSCTKKGACGP